jgi:hypothetical protein
MKILFLLVLISSCSSMPEKEISQETEQEQYLEEPSDYEYQVLDSFDNP